MKSILTVCIGLLTLTAALSAFAQLPTLDSLETSLKTYYNHAWTAEWQEFLISQKGRAFKYIPSVGFTLGLPTVSFNSNKVYEYSHDKQLRGQKLKSLDNQYKIRYNENLNNLRIEYQKILVQEHYLHSLARLSDLKKQEFAIYEEA